jgi:hypothetical protein
LGSFSPSWRPRRRLVKIGVGWSLLPPPEEEASPRVYKQATFLKGKLRQRHVWRRIFLERLTEPLHLNLLSVPVWMFGSFRAKVAFDLVLRHHHAYGILAAADQARALGVERLALLEFGVGGGTGLLNMAHVAAEVTTCTGVEFEIYGFDTGAGLPPPRSYRDHPELFQAGDFRMDVHRLRAMLPPNVHLVLGDVATTTTDWLHGRSSTAPIGFVSVDLDYHYSTKAALRALLGPSDMYLPQTHVYLDDIQEESHNSFCGELLAVEEFNQENELRKIERPYFLPHSRVFHRAPWVGHMFVLHVLDHPTRSTLDRGREPQRLLNPYLTEPGSW